MAKTILSQPLNSYNIGNNYTSVSLIEKDHLKIIKSLGYLESVYVSNCVVHDIEMVRIGDNNFKSYIKQNLAYELAEGTLEKSTFTQILIPEDQGGGVRIAARCVVLSLEEFANIILRCR